MKSKPFYQSKTFWLPLAAILMSVLGYLSLAQESGEAPNFSVIGSLVLGGLTSWLGGIIGRRNATKPLRFFRKK